MFCTQLVFHLRRNVLGIEGHRFADTVGHGIAHFSKKRRGILHAQDTFQGLLDQFGLGNTLPLGFLLGPRFENRIETNGKAP